MSYTDLLINTCTIQTPTDGAQDAYGNPTITWANAYEDEPCRWSTPKHTEVKLGLEVVIADLQLFLGDVDVTEQDRIILPAGSFPIPPWPIYLFEVISAYKRQDGTGDHHVECMLRILK